MKIFILFVLLLITLNIIKIASDRTVEKVKICSDIGELAVAFNTAKESGRDTGYVLQAIDADPYKDKGKELTKHILILVDEGVLGVTDGDIKEQAVKACIRDYDSYQPST